MISSIRLDGTTACMTIDFPTDTEVFRTYVGEVLCPTLRQGDIVAGPDRFAACRGGVPAF